jgi:molybdopterin synthase catalytic subunit
MMLTRIVREPLDVSILIDEVGDTGFGAATVFLGTVRKSAGDGPILAIEYSAYEAMVDTEFEKILGEAAERWPLGKFAAQHRLGRVGLGEASIAIVAATPHRGESFEACRFIIEEVKQRLPVWKKEVFEDGSEGWRENEPCDSAD